jgi:hypothetical protein
MPVHRTLAETIKAAGFRPVFSLLLHGVSLP